ncbi:CHAD domain-containing protein [Thermus sp.]|uniref:CHAD domain-containing protein n=1 Tax=Thermus sp. TaxID=275 RepID=UPI003919AFCC
MRDARAWTEHLRAHIPLALSGEDPEGVHQVRVAARRLRAYLDLLGFRVLQDDLKRLLRGTGRVRDLEVALAKETLPEGFRDFLERELKKARARLPDLLASPWTEALLRALAALPPLGERTATRGLSRLAKRLQKRFRDLRENPSPEALHAYRRALRRLRYAKEFLGLSTREEKKLQEELGSFQDGMVLLGLLREYLLEVSDEEAAALAEALTAALQREPLEERAKRLAAFPMAPIRGKG